MPITSEHLRRYAIARSLFKPTTLERAIDKLGWGNLTVSGGRLTGSFAYLNGRAPRDAAYRRGLEAELERMRTFRKLGRLPGAEPRPPGEAIRK